MTNNEWNNLPIMSQMSNIAGEVKRCIDSKLNFIKGISAKDYSDFYFNKVTELIDLTFDNSKNSYRKREFSDEIAELQRFLNGEVDQEYIMRYWNQFTGALSIK